LLFARNAIVIAVNLNTRTVFEIEHGFVTGRHLRAEALAAALEAGCVGQDVDELAVAGGAAVKSFSPIRHKEPIVRTAELAAWRGERRGGLSMA
jgi:hypothetical protein